MGWNHEEFYHIDGVKYTVKRPDPRPKMKQLLKGGIVVRLDFAKNFDWLHALLEKWKDEPELMKTTYDRINGMFLKMPEGDVLVKVTRLSPTSKETYCMDCYNMSEDKSCELQALANIANVPARYVVVPKNTKGGATQGDRKRILTAAQVMSTILCGAKLYINLTKFRAFDDVTRTEGLRIVDIEPINVFGKEDYLLEWE
ncbi:MAG: hypothetical protein IKE91_00955 [Clostridia bacterium]|nr:hypothetical protein [Clostridia bacterium]